MFNIFWIFYGPCSNFHSWHYNFKRGTDHVEPHHTIYATSHFKIKKLLFLILFSIINKLFATCQ